MPYILAYIFKFSISVGVLYIFYRFVLRPLTFYQWNRFYLGGYALLSFAIPFIDITPWINERDRENSGLLQAIPAIGNVDLLFASGTDFWWAMIIKEKWSLVLLVIVIGSLVMVAKLLYQYLSLLMMKRNAVLVKTAAVNCYEVSGKITPFSFGNSIFINRDLHTAGELQKIMQHEFVHIKQKHSIDILIAETIVVINWFNPFAWLLRNAIRQNLEFIADSNVLQSGIDARQYQYLLLKVIGIPQYSITNHFNFSSLKKRIAMMNKMKTAKLHLVKFLFIVPLLALLLVAFRQRSAVSAQTGEIQALSILSNNTNDTVPRRPAPPPPPENSQTAIAPVLPLGPKQLPTNVNSITIATSSRAIVALKNGEEETYDLDKPEEKLSFEKKYGKLVPPPPPPAPPVAPVPVTKPIPAMAPVPAAAPVPLKLPAPGIISHGDDTISAWGTVNIKVPVNEPLIIVDGEPLPIGTNANSIDPATIESINVLKDKSATELYGKKGENGVVIITSKANSVKSETKVTERINGTTPKINITDKKKPFSGLIIIDGKESTPEAFSKIAPSNISEVKILKGESAIKQYKEKGNNGVMIITTK